MAKKLTFYCDSCGDERRWPRQIKPELGKCELCGTEGLGSLTNRDILSRKLHPRQLRLKL